MTQAANDQVLRALEFLDRAQQYRTSYKQTPNLNRPPEWPKYSLLYLAVELVLKAYLLQQGISRKTLASKKFGHDTKLLVDEAVRLGDPQSTPNARAKWKRPTSAARSTMRPRFLTSRQSARTAAAISASSRVCSTFELHDALLLLFLGHRCGS